MTRDPRIQSDDASELLAEDAVRAARCAYCATGSPQIILSDGMRGHAVACNQAVECGNDPSLQPQT